MRNLKEFDLDAPTLPKQDRLAFRLQTRFVAAHFELCFRRFANPENIWKVLIEVVPVITEKRAQNLLGVLAVQVEGDAKAYLDSTELGKERTALNWLLNGARAAFREHGWPTIPLEEASDGVIGSNFRNAWVWKHAISNPSRSASVEVVIEHGDSEAKIWAVFSSKSGGKPIHVTLCATDPTEFAFIPRLGRLVWLDDETVRLISKSGTQVWDARLSPPTH